jgi:hypothetical protein
MDIDKWLNNLDKAKAHQKKMMPVRKEYRVVKDTYIDLVIVIVALSGILFWLYILDPSEMTFFLPAIGVSVFLFVAYYIFKPRYCPACVQRMKRQAFDDSKIVHYCDSCEVKIVLKVEQGSD